MFLIVQKVIFMATEGRSLDGLSDFSYSKRMSPSVVLLGAGGTEEPLVAVANETAGDWLGTGGATGTAVPVTIAAATVAAGAGTVAGTLGPGTEAAAVGAAADAPG